MAMNIFLWIVVGLVTGSMARKLMPGPPLTDSMSGAPHQLAGSLEVLLASYQLPAPGL